MDAIKELNDYRSKVDSELKQFFKEKLKTAKSLDPYAEDIVRFLEEFTLRGGKRIRATLLFYGYRLFSENKLDEVLKASICIELIQSYLLIHDDIIDRDETRRGGYTAHKHFEMYHEKKRLSGDKKHYGISMAIIAGDLCCHFANEIISDLKIENTYKIKALKELNRIIPWVLYGEGLDVLSELREKIDEESILKIHHLKTATYTFEAPLKIGALLAGAAEKELDILTKYSIPLGKAFQIQDDILGMFGNEEKLGKPIGSDLREGKKTLLMIKAFENSDDDDKLVLKNALGNEKLTSGEIEKVREIIEKSGSLQFSKELAKMMINESKEVIGKLNANKDAKDFLTGIADYMLERDK